MGELKAHHQFIFLVHQLKTTQHNPTNNYNRKRIHLGNPPRRIAHSAREAISISQNPRTCRCRELGYKSINYGKLITRTHTLAGAAARRLLRPEAGKLIGPIHN